MKNIELTNESAQVILSKMEAFKNEKNRLQLRIGVKNLGDGLACQAVLVNAGMMVDIGFKTTGVPTDFVKEAGTYFTINVSAANFISYIKAMLAYNANIELAYDEQSTLYLQVANQARVSIATSAERDPILPCDHSSAYAMIKLETSKFLNAIKIGAFLASNSADPRGVTDRVVFRILPNEIVVYSTDGFIMSKSWCEALAQFNKPNRCVAFLNAKLERLAENTKPAFLEKLKNVATDPNATVALAQEEGYKDGPLSIALPAASMSVLKTLFHGSENLNVMITSGHMVVNAGNVLATFSLAGQASEIFAKSVDPWQNTQWSGQAVVDKETFVNALSIVRLSASQLGEKKGSVPFHTSFQKKTMIVTDRLNNKVSVGLVASAGDLSRVDVHLDVEKVLNALGKLNNGNVVLRYFVNPDGKNYFPVSVSNGDIEGNGTTSFTYILPVNIKKEQPEAQDKNEEKKPAKGTTTETVPPNPSDSRSTVQESEDTDAQIPALPDPGFDEVMDQ